MGWRRRRRTRGPSSIAEHRLAEAIRRNRAELHNEVTEGLLRSEVYRETGRPDVAAEVIEEQRSKLLAFEGRVREALAAAAVEAEAEAVLRAAPGADHLHEQLEPGPSKVPQLLAAAVAAIASLAGLSSLDAARDADSLQAAVRIQSSGEVASPSDTPSKAQVDHLGPFDYLVALHRPTPSGPATADDPVARQWLVEQEALLEALGMDVRVRVEVMRELEGLVASLQPGAPLPDEVWLEVLAQAATRAAAGDEQPAPEEPDGDQPASEAPSDAPSESESDGRSWIPGRTDGTDDGADAEDGEQEPATTSSPDDGEGSSGGDGDGSPTSGDGTGGAPGANGGGVLSHLSGDGDA